MDPERSKEHYRECMRNHAATLGTYAADGCGEYTPEPTTPGGLQCAACGCHRNFHRKYVSAADAGGAAGESLVMAAGLSSLTASEERTDGKRRTRTKFTAEQKERMLRFAEKIGWRIQRKDGDGVDDEEIRRFCREIGVSRQTFKVWMHNHKNSSSSTSSTTTKVKASSLTQ